MVNKVIIGEYKRLSLFYLISYYISNLMLFNPLLTAACVLQLFGLSTQLVPNRQSTIIHKPIGMEISQNERYLMAYNSTHFGIYNTIFGSQVGVVSSALGVKLAVLSGDGKKVSICNNENQVITYNISTMNNDETIQKQSVFNIKEHKLQKTSNVVVDLCYTAENEHLIIAYEDGVIISLTNQIITVTSIIDAVPSRLACGVGSDVGIFTLAAFTLVDQIAFLKMFTVLNDTKEIDQLKIDFQAIGLSSLYSIDMASNPTSIYLSGNSDQIISYAAPSFERRVYYKSVGADQFKFRISNSGFFASANATHITVGNLQQPSQYSAQFQYFESESKTFGLAADGVRFSYISTNGNTIFTSECNQGQYYNTDEKVCKICSSQCSLCTKNQTTCFQCRSGNYIQENRCLKCKSNCMECSSSSNCQRCAEQFVLNNQQCGCKNGYILRENACQRGIQFWVFAAIVGGASFVLCLFAVICVIRSRSIEESKNRLIEQSIQHS